MINYLIKSFLNTYVPKQKYSVEELLYDKEVYPQYVTTKSNFNYAMKNRLLNREDILQIKSMLNKALFKNRHLKDFRYKKFENDAHEIYSKLKCKYLSRKQLTNINKYINKVVNSKSVTTAIVSTKQISQP
ncbi:hypothetical protein [Clostridium botulinum]|uniref:hypothetical protein n=1 Tax=Clostridium botulinum TaxID=1491 RepID=UPI001E654B9B|nr:hypothetical protein [Clostridium botulinum]MCD3202834.1 hypothetical protein [Clostridium botulinum C/D]MCD3230878.1 hypothetical protein [Clostridium botulinum C/D]MCD3253936.1 hypothetical protein [Clostridium botulinum C/D]MCD3279468.1 hypothetical protein [Clostridium botulinum C/D]MCD3282761.1 hypothetical protein [Clostridium botulinum C/D]